MNRVAPALLIVVAVLLGAALLHEYREADHLRALVAQMEKDAAGARTQSNEDASAIHKLKQEVSSYKEAKAKLEAENEAFVKNGRAANSSGDGAAAEGGTGGNPAGGFMKNLAKMFTDPKMKDAMRAQQATVVKMMYRDLGRELGLAPDVAKQVLELLADRQMEMAAKSMSMMSKSGGDPAALAKEMAAAKTPSDDQLKAVLGEQGYAKFQEYEKTVGERVALDQVQQQLSAGGTPLEAGQTEGLLAIMKEERAKSPDAAFSAGKGDPAAQAKIMESDAAAESWLKSQEDFNRRVLDRARAVLSPDQMLALEAAQKQQLEMARMGIQMSREMFKGSK